MSTSTIPLSLLYSPTLDSSSPASVPAHMTLSSYNTMRRSPLLNSSPALQPSVAPQDLLLNTPMNSLHDSPQYVYNNPPLQYSLPTRYSFTSQTFQPATVQPPPGLIGEPIQGKRAWSKVPASKPARIQRITSKMYKTNPTPRKNHSQPQRNHGMLDLQKMISERLICDLATDQNSSRSIQQQLQQCSSAEKEAIFEQIRSEALRLCTDVFGNYVVQKVFEYGTPVQKRQLAMALQYNILSLSLQMFGCRVVQKVLESVDSDTQYILVKELDGHILDCVRDQNGNHVIQKCIEKLKNRNIDFILRAFNDRVFDLSTHPFGCRVIQRVLEHCDREQKEPILREIMAHIEHLAYDQYGNYVLQHVLQHSSSHSHFIVKSVAKKILLLSKHKFASNVVEKCFLYCTDEHKGILLHAVIGHGDNGPLIGMVRDQYGNFVIQKMLQECPAYQQKMLIRKILEYVPQIRKNSYGKHIVQKIEKLTGKAL